MNRSILLIGKVPPPIGGVSVFVMRYYHKLVKEGNGVTLFPGGVLDDISVVLKLICHSYNRIIVNTMSIPMLTVLFITFNLSKVELIDHNHSRHFNGSLKTKLKLYFIAKMHQVHLVDEHLKKNYPAIPVNFHCINTFIEPTEEEVTEAKGGFPKPVHKLIENSQHVFVISAGRLVLENNIDLYGIERTCSIFKSLLASYPNIALVVCIGDPSENTLILENIKSSVETSPQIVFWEGCSSSWCLFSDKVTYLRPTSTDGNSISIHEALFYNASVITSDVVPRPRQCVLFEYESDQDYMDKITFNIRENN